MTREAKGQALFERGAVTLVDAHTALVASSTEEPHQVTRRGSVVTCTCPDYQHRGQRCKHIFAEDLARAAARSLVTTAKALRAVDDLFGPEAAAYFAASLR